jgi:hypothetical protein
MNTTITEQDRELIYQMAERMKASAKLCSSRPNFADLSDYEFGWLARAAYQVILEARKQH